MKFKSLGWPSSKHTPWTKPSLTGNIPRRPSPGPTLWLRWETAASRTAWPRLCRPSPCNFSTYDLIITGNQKKTCSLCQFPYATLQSFGQRLTLWHQAPNLKPANLDFRQSKLFFLQKVTFCFWIDWLGFGTLAGIARPEACVLVLSRAYYNF